MLQLACHNHEINWKIEEVKIMRYPEEYKKQQRQSRKNQNGKNRKKKTKNRKKKTNEKRKKKRKKSKKGKMMNIKKVAKEWEIWDKEEKVVKLGEDAKKLAPLRFHRQIYVFGEKESERMLVMKMWDYTMRVFYLWNVKTGSGGQWHFSQNL